MTPSLTPSQVDALLQAAGRGSVVHLIGAGGCGMSGLGHLLLDLGHDVTGSDLTVNEDARQLQARGARIRAGHDGEFVRAMNPMLVVHSPAVDRANPELAAARQTGIPVVRRAVLLAAFLHRQRGISVAGMHGKTTTSAWLAFALEQLAARPSYAVGARLMQLPCPARFSISSGSDPSWFVAETDESDGTLCCFHPEHALLLNVDADHLDYFRDLEAVCHEYGQFAQQVQGWRVYCKDDPHLCRLLDGEPRTVSFGFHAQADYRVEALAGAAPGSGPNEGARSGEQTFVVWRQGVRLGPFTTRLLGDKNLSNATAVVALLHRLGYGTDQMVPALALFRGAARRQELIFRGEQLSIYDDYGHHPSEVRAVLQALKSLGARRLLVAFQPHRYTRTQHLLSEFATCFNEADLLWLTEIYPANEAPLPGVSGSVLAQAIRAQGQEVHYIPALSDLGPTVMKAVQPGDLVLFLGAGDITKVAHDVAGQYRQGTASVPQLDQAAKGPLTLPACVCEPLLAWRHLAPAGTLEVLG